MLHPPLRRLHRARAAAAFAALALLFPGGSAPRPAHAEEAAPDPTSLARTDCPQTPATPTHCGNADGATVPGRAVSGDSGPFSCTNGAAGVPGGDVPTLHLVLGDEVIAWVRNGSGGHGQAGGHGGSCGLTGCDGGDGGRGGFGGGLVLVAGAECVLKLEAGNGGDGGAGGDAGWGSIAPGTAGDGGEGAPGGTVEYRFGPGTNARVQAGHGGDGGEGGDDGGGVDPGRDGDGGRGGDGGRVRGNTPRGTTCLNLSGGDGGTGGYGGVMDGGDGQGGDGGAGGDVDNTPPGDDTGFVDPVLWYPVQALPANRSGGAGGAPGTGEPTGAPGRTGTVRP